MPVYQNKCNFKGDKGKTSQSNSKNSMGFRILQYRQNEADT